jgi:hypothetical protein
MTYITAEERLASVAAKLQAAVDAIARGKRDRRLCLVGPVTLRDGRWTTHVATAPGAIREFVWGSLDGDGAKLLREAKPLRDELIALLKPHFHRVLSIAQEAQFAASRAWHWPWANRETTE